MLLNFLYQISSVLKGDRNKNAIGMAARAFVEDHYDHNTIAIKLLNKYKSLKSNPNYKKPAHML